jgi:hypothetical protein
MLYNGAAMEAPIAQRRALLSGPVQEGRELFSTRVSPRLAHVFEEAVAELVVQPLGVEPPSAPVAVSVPVRHLDPVAERASSLKPVLVVVAILIVAAAVVFLVR